MKIPGNFRQAFWRGFQKQAGISGIDTELLPHQQRALDKATNEELLGIILAHEPGSGKSLTSIAIANALGKPATVVAPASLLSNYQKEIDKHTNKKSVPFNLVSLQNLSRKPELLPGGGGTLIVDEAHRLRQNKSKAYEAIAKAEYAKKILMTGTPIYNSPVDLTNLVNIVNVRDQEQDIHNYLFPSTMRDILEKDYGKEIDEKLKILNWREIRPYFSELRKEIIQKRNRKYLLNLLDKYQKIKEKHPQYKNESDVRHYGGGDLHRAMKDIAIEQWYQQTKSKMRDVREERRDWWLEKIKGQLNKYVDIHKNEPTDFPEKIETTVEVPMTAPQMQEYKHYFAKLPRDLQNKILTGSIEKMPPSQMENPFLVRTRTVSNIVGEHSPKIDKMMEDFHKVNGKTVIYSNFLEQGVIPITKRLAAEGIPYAVFTGGSTPKEKKQAIADYNSGKIKALVVFSAGGEGLDLKGTRLMQIMEPHWNEEKINQVIGRAARFRSHADLPENERNVTVKKYVATIPGYLTVENYMKNLGAAKQEKAKQIIDFIKPAFWRGFTKQAEDPAKAPTLTGVAAGANSNEEIPEHVKTQTYDTGKTHISVPLLHKQITNNEITEIPVERLQGDLRLRPGDDWSEKKVQQADFKFPIIVDQDYHVLDGRHRIEKSKRLGRKTIKVQMATPEQIAAASLDRTPHLDNVKDAFWRGFHKQADLIEDLKPYAKPAAFIGAALLLPKIVDLVVGVGDAALRQSMKKEIVANGRPPNFPELLQRAREVGGIKDIPHVTLPGYANASYIPPGSIPSYLQGSLQNTADRLLKSPDLKKQNMGKFLITGIKYSQNPQGGIIIGDKFNDEAIVAHELGHAIVHANGGLPSLIQNHNSTAKTVGLLASAGGLVTSLFKPDLGNYLFFGGLATYGLGAMGKIYSEYTASEKAKQLLKNTRHHDEKLLNLGLGTYGLREAGDITKQLGFWSLPRIM